MLLAELITAIRQEVQESVASVWTDAELTRALQKSIALMSRLLPKRSVVESTIVIDVDSETVTTPAAASTTAIVNAQSINVAAGNFLTIAGQPDIPRKLNILITDADSSTYEAIFIILGLDENNLLQKETYVYTKGQSKTLLGKRIFKYVSSVELELDSGSGAGDTASVGTGNAYQVPIALANKGIKWDSEAVTNAAGTTTYTRDTDYRIDYANGTLTYVSGGSMAAATAYLISYDLDPYILDIGTLLPKEDYIKIERIEYPVGQNPPTYITYETFGDILQIKGKDVSFSEDEHLRIQYLKPWTAPSSMSRGDYPEHLDNAVIIGSVGQALIFKAEKYTQQAVTEIALANASADSMATPLADINVALDKITTHVAEADSALDKVATHVGQTSTALDKVTTYLETNGTTDNAKDVLSNITDDIAELRTAIETALDLFSTYATNATTPPSAHDYLVDGDDFINTSNAGQNVAENYIKFAEASIQIYNSLIAQASVRLNNLKSYIDEANGWVKMGETFILEGGQRNNMALAYVQEAEQRLGMAGAFINEAIQRVNEVNAWSLQADKYVATSNQYLNIAGRYLASGQAKINEMIVMLGVKAEFNFYKSSSEQFS